MHLIISFFVFCSDFGSVMGKKIVERLTKVKDGVSDLGIASVFALIGFVLWDRRTTIMPVVRELGFIQNVNLSTLEVL